MDGEWWKAETTVVLHFRPWFSEGYLTERPICGRALRWTAHDEAAKRVDRCGYCTLRLYAQGGVDP